MEAAIIYCNNCPFSQNAEGILRGYFAKMNTSDFENLEIDVKLYDLREIDHQTVMVAIRKASIKVVIVSQYFLQHLPTTVKSSHFNPLNRILNSKVIGILVRVTKEEIQSCEKLLPHVEVWDILELRTAKGIEPHFCKAFTEQVIRSYNIGKSFNQPKIKLPNRLISSIPSPASPPIQIFDEDSHSPNPDVNILGTFRNMSADIIQEKRKLTITLDKPVNSGDIIKIELKKSKQVDNEQVFIVTFQIPELIPDPEADDDSFTAEIAAPNRLRQGSSESYTHAIGLDITIQRLPGYRKYLDEHVSETLSKHFKNDTSFESDPELQIILEIQEEKLDQFPTLMHLAVHYGLDRSVWTLLEEGDGLGMLDVRNCDGYSPLEIAANMGFSLTIGKAIQDCKDVMVTWEALQYMKSLYEALPRRKLSTLNMGFMNKDKGKSYDSLNYTENNVPRNSTERIAEGNCSNFSSSQMFSSVGEVGQSRFLPDVVIGTAEEDLQAESASTEKRGAVRYNSGQYFSNDNFTDTIPDDPKINMSPTINDNSYSVPPEPRPVLPPKMSKKKKLVEPPENNPVMLKKDGTIPRGMDGYILMNDPKTQSQSFKNDDDYLSGTDGKENSIDQTSDKTKSNLELDVKSSLSQDKVDSSYNLDAFPQKPDSSLNTTKTVCLVDSTDVELLEILIGVKEAAISMNDVEDIFAAFMGRADVQQSYQEKQKDLEVMRTEYARVARTREEASNPAWFDRIVKIFGKTRTKRNDTSRFGENSDDSQMSTSQLVLDPSYSYPSPTNEDDKPLPILRRKELTSTTEKIWGNAMCRKCVGVSYIEPSAFSDYEPPPNSKDDDANAAIHVDEAQENMSQNEPTNINVKTPILDNINSIKDEETSSDKRDVESLKQDSTKLNYNQIVKIRHSSLELQTQDPTSIQSDPEKFIDPSSTPPPLPPKKNLKLPFGVNKPVPLPRKLQESSLHLITYSGRKVDKMNGPDYTNSPSKEVKSSPPY